MSVACLLCTFLLLSFLDEYALATSDNIFLLQTKLEMSTRHTDEGRRQDCKQAEDDTFQPMEFDPELISHLSPLESKPPSDWQWCEGSKDMLALHQERKRELEAFSTKPLDFIFYGASITEQWRESCGGMPCNANVTDPCNGDAFRQNVTGNIQTFEKFFGPFERSAIMGVGGDSSQNLLWRLENGEGPPQKPKAIILQIGSNDISYLGAYYFTNPAAQLILPRPNESIFPISEESMSEEKAEILSIKVYLGIEAVVRNLLTACQVPIVLTTLFPAGYLWPAGPFGQIVPRVNALLKDLGAKNNLLHVIDCPQALLQTSSNKIDPDLTADYIHPLPAGMERWAACMSHVLQEV